jgi:hypothetical protein
LPYYNSIEYTKTSFNQYHNYHNMKYLNTIEWCLWTLTTCITGAYGFVTIAYIALEFQCSLHKDSKNDKDCELSTLVFFNDGIKAGCILTTITTIAYSVILCVTLATRKMFMTGLSVGAAFQLVVLMLFYAILLQTSKDTTIGMAAFEKQTFYKASYHISYGLAGLYLFWGIYLSERTIMLAKNNRVVGENSLV